MTVVVWPKVEHLFRSQTAIVALCGQVDRAAGPHPVWSGDVDNPLVCRDCIATADQFSAPVNDHCDRCGQPLSGDLDHRCPSW